MKVDVIVGGLYGDKGKGKIISYLGDETKFKVAYIGVGRRKSDLIKL